MYVMSVEELLDNTQFHRTSEDPRWRQALQMQRMWKNFPWENCAYSTQNNTHRRETL